jgi:hypothetical protein
MQLPMAALRAGFGWIRRNPGEIFHAARNAAGLKSTLPLDALRWLVANMPASKKAPKDVVIGQKPPALTIGATIDLMGTPVRARAAIKIDELRLGAEELRVTVRLSDVGMEVLGDSASPVAALIKSGALDLSRPGNLANFMPKRPPALVEAKDDRLVVDLMKVPKLAENKRLRKILSVITPVLVLRDLRVEDDHLVLAWRPRPSGIGTSLMALRPSAPNGAHHR